MKNTITPSQAIALLACKITTLQPARAAAGIFYKAEQGAYGYALLQPYRTNAQAYSAELWRFRVNRHTLPRPSATRCRAWCIAKTAPLADYELRLTCTREELCSMATWLGMWILAHEAGRPELVTPCRFAWRADAYASGYLWTPRAVALDDDAGQDLDP